MSRYGDKNSRIGEFTIGYRIMSGLFGCVGLIVIIVSIFAIHEVKGELVDVHGRVALREGLTNPITWFLFGGFLLLAVVFWFGTRKNKGLRIRYDEATLRDDLSTANIDDVARELWVPINEIADRSAAILLADQDGESDEHIMRLITANEEISTVVNEMVDFSMIASQKMQIVEKPYRIKELLEATHEMLAGGFAKKGLAFTVTCDPHVPVMLIGDAPRLQQIMMTVLSNSMKYTDSGEVTLSVGLEPLFAGDVGLVISIRDTGRGMSKETCDNLFAFYMMAANGQEAGFKGTGLGMAIVKRLLELMKGTVSVSSELGVGTVFHLRIPQRVYDVAEVGETTI